MLLENYYLPGDLEAQIGRFIEYYNHPSSNNLSPELLRVRRQSIWDRLGRDLAECWPHLVDRS